ncbi:hypothetical protein ED312_03660 [Sinomicrobium pectinilyticum]|uniref:Exo-alpha-sialidase n=1 Tax=Sinomicrobium pectinilyticum TaxID=1084421 RepID=A0A3N0EX40_SINP1|nr:PD40 domain-containing protein [Sinomicrobium pectinilyticum]RNL92269.1 hypothetical protein ED312_03660 [Sinomicrobium pectinilyticum]
MKKHTILICLLIMGCSRHPHRDLAISYPFPRPDSTALTFLPGIISGDSLDFNAAFSPDGTSCYFSRSSGGVSDIYVTQFEGDQWQLPEMVSFSKGPFSEADPVFAPNGALYFISDRPSNEKDTLKNFNIWYVKPNGKGKWTEPVNERAVNSDSTEYYISFSANGNLYLASNRPGGYGSHDIYMSRLEDGAYTTPVNLGPAINAPQMEHDPYVTPDENAVIFTSVNRDDSKGTADLYYSVKSADNTWTPSRNLGTLINTPTYDFCPYISPDGKYFFFSSERDVKWIKTDALPGELKQLIVKTE